MAAGRGDADRMAREAFDASFCSDPDRYDAYFERNRSVAEMRRDPLVRLTESVRVQRFTGGVDKAERRVRAQVGKAESRYAGLLYDFRASEGIAHVPNAQFDHAPDLRQCRAPESVGRRALRFALDDCGLYGEIQPRRV